MRLLRFELQERKHANVCRGHVWYAVPEENMTEKVQYDSMLRKFNSADTLGNAVALPCLEAVDGGVTR